MATGTVGGRPRRAMKPFPPKKQLFEEEVLVWRMVYPGGVDADPGNLFEGCREITFGLMLPRCFVIMVGYRGGGEFLDWTHQEKDDLAAASKMFEWTVWLEKRGAVMQVEPQTVRVPTGVETDEWGAVMQVEWVKGVLIPTVDELPTAATV